MRRLIDLNRREYKRQDLRAGAYLNSAQVIPCILLVSFFFFSHCSVHLSEKASKGVKILQFKKNGKKIILYEDSYALLIGVSKYEHWPDLDNIPKEINALESSLKKQGFMVDTSLNPTGEKLRKIVKNFIDGYGFKTNNRLLIFFSGHGYTRKDGKKGYIVPSDAVDPLDDEVKFAQKAIEMEQIQTWAKRIESKHALFVFDSCFAGTIFQTRAPSPPGYITYLTAESVRQFITAGSSGETVPGRSKFVKCFIKGIEGEADYDRDGYITGTDLGKYIQKKIIGYEIGQTPQFGKIRDPALDQGDFVFILKTKTEPVITKKIKSVLFLDLAIEVKRKYKEELEELNINIGDLAKFVKVVGKITLKIDVSHNGNITIRSFNTEKLKVEPIDANDIRKKVIEAKESIRRVIQGEIMKKKLIPPIDSRGTLVNLEKWKLVYIVRSSKAKIKLLELSLFKSP